ncbi:putative conjugative transfer protein TraI [Legionella busanensis]|uniref:Putative conjugative transfer protein TraI n=1 Tax=Legionella busanensis TaxID=190655 RepID=A0A378KCN6_9GAMM|nr:conjugative transfer relaxase/helicase TraI [Legionella busanensis]STX81271.1 putative conjugative transfer protein TraI [Legionella busanensis]
MLTIKPLKKAKDAQHYYSEKDNYYLTDKDTLKDSSLWMGNGATELGLRGVVEPSRFLSLLNGELPNGKALGIVKNGVREHRAGTDITLSAPKSVSILALVGQDERIIRAHQTAVQTTFLRIEAMAAEARITFNKETAFEKTNNLTAATFLHTSSRDLDPDLHTHIIIMNITKRLDEQWRALSSRTKEDRENLDHGFREIIYQNQHYFGLVYMSTLAKEIRELGYDIRIKDIYGNFEIEGIPEELIKDLSKRREEIIHDMKEKGYFSAKAAEISNGVTRKKKADIDSISLLAKWLEEIKTYDVNLDALITTSKNKENRAIYGNTLPQIKEFISRDVKEAIQDAIAHLSEYNMQIKHATLVRLAFSFAAGKIDHNEIEQEIDNLLQSGKLSGKEFEYYTTKELLEKEKEFTRVLLANPKDTIALETSGTGSAAAILSQKQRIQVVDVNGLANQKTLIQDFVDIADRNKVNVYVLHQGRNQVEILSNEIKRTNNSLFSWLMNLFKDDIVHTVGGFKYHYGKTLNTDEKESLIIVHDAQKISIDDLNSLNNISSRSRGRLILLNNIESTLGYSPGNPIKTLKENGINHTLCLSARKNISVNLHLSKNPENDLIKTWMGYDRKTQINSTIVALTNRQLSELNTHVREELIHRGIIGNKQEIIDVLSAINLTQAQKQHSKFFAVGDRITFKAFTKNQTHYTVKSIEDSKLILESDSNIESKFNLRGADEFIVSRKKGLNLAIGDVITNDRLIIFKNNRIEKGGRFQILDMNVKSIHLKHESNILVIDRESFSSNYFSYGYCKKLNGLKGKEENILISAKPHQLNKNLSGELSEYAKNILLFTTNLNKAQNFLDSEQIKWTAADILKKTPDTIYRNASYADKIIEKDIKLLLKNIEIRDSLDRKEVAKMAVSYAIAKCAERQAAFKHSELMLHALKHALGKADFNDISPILKERIKILDLVHLDTCWTTKDALILEEDIIRANFSEQGKVAPIMRNLNQVTLPHKLTQGQRQAILQAISTTDRFVSVQGLAGVGKTTMMQQIQDIAVTNGFQVLGLAPTHQAKSELIKQGIQALTIDHFLTNETSINDKSLLIIDEASMIDNVKYHELQKRIISGNARGIFTGDITQLQSLASGIPHELTIKTQSQKVVFMDEIMRQNPNPELKRAAEFASRREIRRAFEVLGKIDPEKYITRDKPFVHKLKSSIIEIPCALNEEGQKDYKPIYKAIANDYLSRTTNCQEQTIVIVHAHKDRDTIDTLIRHGLKRQNQISQDGQKINRLFSKSMDKADMLYIENFRPGDILRFGKTYHAVQRNEYLTVSEVNKNNNELICKTIDGITLNIKPNTLIHAKAALYSHAQFELACGDKIRLKLSNEEKGHVSNRQYTVASIKDNIVWLKNGEEQLKLDTKNPCDQHWDYAYTNTAYSSQGATTKLAIALELENRVVVTTHRSHEIDITRASDQVSIYTDNAKNLVDRLENKIKQRHVDKTSAIIEADCYLEDKKQTLKVGKGLLSRRETITNERMFSKETKKEIRVVAQGNNVHIDADHILSCLNQQGNRLAISLLGEPNTHLSNNRELRYGSKGSLKINLDKGLWYNFETGESGNFFQLIQNELQLKNFKETLDFAVKFTHHIPIQKYVKHQDVSKDSLKNKPDKKIGMRDRASELYAKSKPIKGSIIEKYLIVHRGIHHFENSDLRYCPSVPSKKDGQGCYSPALLAFAKDKEGNINHVQVTRINQQTANKDKMLDITKQTYGTMNGFAVNLNHKGEGEVTYLTEGIETGLSILETNPKARVYSTLGKQNFYTINTDYLSKEVIMCFDNDGDNSFKHLKGKESNVLIDAATRLVDKGFNVLISLSKIKNRDLNDVLLDQGVKGVENELKLLISVDEFKKLCADFNKKINLDSVNKEINLNVDKIHKPDFLKAINQPELANKGLIERIKYLSINKNLPDQAQAVQEPKVHKKIEIAREL